MDLALDPLDPDVIAWADAVACSVPMHTAMRLALTVCDEIRACAPSSRSVCTASTRGSMPDMTRPPRATSSTAPSR